MKRTLKFLLLISIAALLAGCKLAVIVVEGGEVRADGSGTCVASSICVVDVTDPDFSETFKAVPDEGWYFQKWNSGDRFFCGGSTYSTCLLSFQGFEESKAVEHMVASSETFYLMPVFKPYKDVITVDGKEWLQPAFFTTFSWNEINDVCPEGACSGFLYDYDSTHCFAAICAGYSDNMTGWTWASSDDVNTLFNSYEKAGRAILEDFAYTATDKYTQGLYAILSDPPYEGPEYDRAYAALVIGGVLVPDAPEEIHHITLLPYNATGGAWFWRPSD